MRYLLLLLVAALFAACTPAANGPITAVTPLPDDFASATPRPTVTPQAEDAAAEPTALSAAATTPTPLNNDLPVGSAREIAQATDTAMYPTVESPLAFDEDPVPIRFDEFYDGFDMRQGLLLSQKLLSLDGQQVVMEGYMAPPLKPELDFFVLTRIRLQFCPFCSTAGDWPDDIALVYMPEGETTLALTEPVRITGTMEIGISVDAETGMVSLVRLYADRLEVIG
jgi:hypothetical protein